MTEVLQLADGLEFGESPRWHDERLWVANWGAAEIVTVGLDGTMTVALPVPTTIPFSIDWLPDGRMLIVAGPQAQLHRLEGDGSLVLHADLSAFGSVFNELVVDGRGNIYVNGAGSNPMSDEEPTLGQIVLVTPDGAVREVAQGINFANGMAVTPDNRTLIVAESHGGCLTAFDIHADGGLSGRRVWAELEGGFPDGICLDAGGACWYADVPNKRCIRVQEGGHVTDTVQLDRGAFACMLGGPTGTSLFIAGSKWRGMDHMFDARHEGKIYVTEVDAPHVGWP